MFRMKENKNIKQESTKIASIIDYLINYFEDPRNVNNTYFTPGGYGVQYLAKTNNGIRYIEWEKDCIRYKERHDLVFEIHSNGEVISKIPIKDVSLALYELVELTRGNCLKLSIQDKDLDWWE